MEGHIYYAVHCKKYPYIHGYFVVNFPYFNGTDFVYVCRPIRRPGLQYSVDLGLTHLLHSELHWLDVPQRIQFKLGVTVHRCLQGNAPQYLVDWCKSTTEAVSRQWLRSASRHQLIVPRHRRSSFGRRAFSVAGPMVWNSLPDFLRGTLLCEDTFRRSLKTYFFALY